MSAATQDPLQPVASAAAGDDDGDDPSPRDHLSPTHTVDADPPFPELEEKDIEEEGVYLSPPRAADGPHQCHVCSRAFGSSKSLHGHMRGHPKRRWRGSVPPSMRPGIEREVANSLILLSSSGGSQHRKYSCEGCHQVFDTGQALGGHRASHRRRMGCSAKTRGREDVREKGGEEEEEASAAAAGTSSKVVVDLNTVPRRRRRRRRRRKRRQVDLNLPPPISTSEEEVTASGIDDDGSSSSSS